MLIQFHYPQFLSFLLLVPFFVFVYFWSIIYNKRKAVNFPNFEAMERISGTEFLSRNILSLYLNLFILCLMVFATAGAAISFESNSGSFSHIILIDNSQSMAANDFSPNRLEVAKSSAKNFVDSLPVGTKVGVIAFSGDSIIVQELDDSKIRVKMAIDSIDFGDVQGTNIYNAIIAADKLFDSNKLKSVVLISDGQLNVGETLDIIDYANENNITINTLAIGSSEGGVTDLNTISKMDEDILKSLSFNTQGQFFRIQENNEFDKSFDSIIDKSKGEVSMDLSLYLILASIILFSFNWILNNFKFRIIP